jgi:hypothetical protein
MQRLLAVLVIIMASVSTANAGNLEQSTSYLDIRLGSIPKLRLGAQTTSVTLSGGGTPHIVEEAYVFQTEEFTIYSSAFTGNPSLSGFLMSLRAGAGDYSDSASYPNPIGPGTVNGFGGISPFSGSSILQVLGYNIDINMNIMGHHAATLAPVLQNNLIVTGAPFNTGTVMITDVETPALYVPSLGITGVAFTLDLSTVRLITATPLTVDDNLVQSRTVTIQGSNNLTPSGMGSIKMIAPFRIRTTDLKRPGAMTKTFTFVPEPAIVLQLVTGAAFLAWIGRRRSR